MARQWTKQQHNAIYSTDGSVLVSAAAGSGKTAVLVERVKNLITRENNPIDADRLLIVTFTRAAAAEMRSRLSDELSLLLESDPYNANLLRQRQLLYNANICTIDSFCSSLVREYFHTLQINSDFRNAEDSELKILENQALDISFEYFYSNNDDFSSLVNAFSSNEGDKKLRETVLKICEFLSTQPFPDKWLDDMLRNYNESSVSKTIWGQIIIDNAQKAAMHAVNITENSIKMLSEDNVLYDKLIPLFSTDLEFLQKIQEKLYTGSWDEIREYIFSFVTGTLRAPKDYTEHPLKLAVAANRNEVKGTVKEMQSLFGWTEEKARQEIAEVKSLASTLFELVRYYLKTLSELKLKKNILSFADIESLTVKLLATPDGDTYKKTEQAQEISNRFDAVMVDEFQDVNDVQDLIFKCVSTNENNIFVVGDVKQSIYGFRQAKPEIFIKRKEKYKRFNEQNPEYPATIILDRNFRSRAEVCDAVNFIFSRLMAKDSAQMDYTADERLNAGAVYPASDNCNFELDMIEKNSFDETDTAVIEANYIARKIRKMMSEGFKVTDGNTQRNATYGDFAVIMRSTKNTASTYVKVLAENGIPAFSDKKSSFFDAQEIKIILNLLRVINNPSLDIPLLSVLCSPIYGFTPDELAEMRADSRYKNLYNSLLEYSKQSEKAVYFLKELEKLRNLSYICGIDELIGRIYDETGFLAVTSAVSGSADSVKNLYTLKDYARSYEKNGYKTLSDFIGLIDRMIENNTPLSAISSGDEQLNGVRVMSIHSSKGLEFPVCFISDTARQFNKYELRNADVLVDSHAGLGVKKKDGFFRYKTLPMLAVRKEIEKNSIAEEIRILYVALTRAKEKLIVVSTRENVDKYLEKQYSKIVLDKIIEPYTVSNCDSISDFITLCALVHPSLNCLRKSVDSTAAHIFNEENAIDWKFNFIDSSYFENENTDAINVDELVNQIADLINSSEKISALRAEKCAEILNKNINFEYPNKDIMNLPQKVSASLIAHEQNSEYFDRILQKPNFLKGKTASAVERGTAHHRFLQYCDFSAARDDIKAEVKRLIDSNVFDAVQAELIDTEKLSELLHIELFDRIIKSSKVMREEQFFAKISPSLVYDSYKSEKNDCGIILQGAVDLAFLEDNRLVIVDYKTDRVASVQKLKDLYSKQLELYKAAMESTTELQVKECVICSVWLNEYITV